MKTAKIKLELLRYWRFKRQFVCCTELTLANCCISDVVAFDFKDTFIDCEVKISKSDLLADKKKRKHDMYLGARINNRLPNKFMYCVPKKLADDAISQCELINPKYGVMIFHESGWHETIRKAKKLFTGISKENTQKIIIKRLNSEVINLRINKAGAIKSGFIEV
jgi:hypothetical protein